MLCSYQSTKTQIPIHVYSHGFTEINDYQKSIKNSRSAPHILPSTKFYFSQQGDDDDDDDDDDDLTMMMMMRRRRKIQADNVAQ